MFENDTLQESEKWARLSMERMLAAKVPATPENYTLYYAYSAGKNSDLTKAMDEIHGEGPVKPRALEELYAKFFGFEGERKALSDTNASVNAELVRVMQLLETNSADAGRYNETLENFSGTLKGQINLEQLKVIVGRVAAETKFITDQNKKLQDQLSNSSEQMAQLRQNLDSVRRETLIDALTEIGNRKHFNSELKRTTTEAAETGLPLALLMIDIDFFKKFNDTHGHLVGDQVLRLVARTLRENLKGRDIVARYGGEEFAILLTATKLADAIKVADHLRVSVGNKKITRKPTGESLGIITLSIGATLYAGGEDLNAFIQRADAALYEAKGTGRNRVVAHEAGQAAAAGFVSKKAVADPAATIETEEKASA